MTEVDAVGGVPVVMKALLDADLLHGDCLTVTGQTIAENLADVAPPGADGRDGPRDERSTRSRVGSHPHGSLAPEGAVAKASGHRPPPCSRQPARVRR